jgi:TfoX/Sxy family transcriptional regulator of competence genes
VAYDVQLAERVRAVVGRESGLTEKRMFGGLAYLVDGNLAVSVSGEGGLMVRVDPATTQSLLDEPQVRPCEMRGRSMAGWIRVAAEGVDTEVALRRWVALGLARARALPAKEHRRDGRARGRA